MRLPDANNVLNCYECTSIKQIKVNRKKKHARAFSTHNVNAFSFGKLEPDKDVYVIPKGRNRDRYRELPINFWRLLLLDDDDIFKNPFGVLISLVSNGVHFEVVMVST